MNYNKVIVAGRVTSDLELKSVPNGNSVVNFSVATNRNWTDSSGNKQEQVEFHNIEMWGKLAEIADKYLIKGQEVLIDGRLSTRNWEAEDGTKRYKTSIVAENMQMGSKPNGSDNSNAKAAKPDAKPDTKKEEDVSIEDIPF